MFRAKLVIGWLLVASIAGGVALRWSTVNTPVAIALVGVIGMALLVPLALLGFAAWRDGSRTLRIGAALVLMAYLVTFANPRAVIGCGGRSADDQIRIVEHNVYLYQGDPVRVASALTASAADIVVLVEVWPEFMEALARQPGLDGYAYRATEPSYTPTGLAIWSRWPLDATAVDTVGRRQFIHTAVQRPDGPFTVMAVHTSGPVEPSSVGDWGDQLRYLASFDHSQPTVLAGDFNATIDHAQFRRLLASGWSDVHTTKGCGFDLTWPTSWGTGVALMRLDHVLVTDHFEVLAVDLGDPNGSDHRSVIAAVRLKQMSAP
jgi:endonuclease/exonuclease/phosphatase (EEP) superfamily protein YafD